jgi:hypothetical protein
MKMQFHILYIAAILVSFFIGAGSMYYFIASRTYMQYGIMLDRNHDIDKFGVKSGKDFSKDYPYNYVPVDWLAKEVEIKTLISAYKDCNSKSIKAQVTRMAKMAKSERYKIYFFSSPITMWASLSGVEGYCIVESASMKYTKEWIIPTGVILTLN